MEKNNGVKVTYVETQFVTSDAAGFKSLVQRLTGKSPARKLHRPRPRRADGRSAAAGPSGCFMPATAGPARASAAANDDVRTADAGAAQPCLDELHGLCDYSELFGVVGAAGRHHGGSSTGFPY
ncbi:hypothetical protein ZWY2020_021946 [Hordeum vulgare]|nr:hypothetical protein ZWY2020_021946 [Hordeum vulgare]